MPSLGCGRETHAPLRERPAWRPAPHTSWGTTSRRWAAGTGRPAPGRPREPCRAEGARGGATPRQAEASSHLYISRSLSGAPSRSVLEPARPCGDIWPPRGRCALRVVRHRARPLRVALLMLPLTFWWRAGYFHHQHSQAPAPCTPSWPLWAALSSRNVLPRPNLERRGRAADEGKADGQVSQHPITNQ